MGSWRRGGPAQVRAMTGWKVSCLAPIQPAGLHPFNLLTRALNTYHPLAAPAVCPNPSPTNVLQLLAAGVFLHVTGERCLPQTATARHGWGPQRLCLGMAPARLRG